MNQGNSPECWTGRNRDKRSEIKEKEIIHTSKRRFRKTDWEERRWLRIFQNERKAWVIRAKKLTTSWAGWINKSTPKHIIVTPQNTKERANLTSNWEDKLPIKNNDLADSKLITAQSVPPLSQRPPQAVNNVESKFCFTWLQRGHIPTPSHRGLPC